MLKSTRHLGRVLASAIALAGAIALLSGASSPAHQPVLSRHARASAASHRAHGPFAVGKIVVRLIDTSRRVHFRGERPEPRQLVTVIRYPAIGDPSTVDAPGAEPATGSGPFPLVVFGHGFKVTPGTYAQLLQAWARAGYVVAAPVFPRSNEYAPGGPDEADIVNQPADMSFVISQALAASAAGHGILSHLIEPHEVAVAGQSDGAATALATAYDQRYLDRRVDAAIVLSGAEIMPGAYFRSRNPPLLAAQGTADTVNLPKYTYEYFRAAHTPKFLLSLLGARHLRPYTTEQPQLSVVERVTIAFLDRYLKRLPTRSQLWSAGDTAQVARLSNGR